MTTEQDIIKELAQREAQMTDAEKAKRQLENETYYTLKDWIKEINALPDNMDFTPLYHTLTLILDEIQYRGATKRKDIEAFLYKMISALDLMTEDDEPEEASAPEKTH